MPSLRKPTNDCLQNLSTSSVYVVKRTENVSFFFPILHFVCKSEVATKLELQFTHIIVLQISSNSIQTFQTE